MSTNNAPSEQVLRRMERKALLLRFTLVLLYALLLLFCLFLALPLIKNVRAYPALLAAWNLDHQIALFIKRHVKTVFFGVDILRWVLLGLTYLLTQRVQIAAEDNASALRTQRYQDSYAQWVKSQNLPADSPILKPLERQLANTKMDEDIDREELLQLFAEAKRRLDALGRDLAFLAVDVVDSTGMKKGEDQVAVMHAFGEYRRYVESKFEVHGCLKASWTPDGVMACFPTVDDAVSTAIDIIEGLPHFNRKVQIMKRDFEVRCGVNFGYVYFDETQPLEQLSDRVLDITGHLQKHASPNSVYVARPAIEPLRERSGFFPSERVISGYEVYEWRPDYRPSSAEL